MDTAGVISAALAGAIGGGGGAALGALISRLFPRLGRMGATALTVLGVVLSYSFATPYIERVIGPVLRDAMGPPEEIAEASRSLREHAAFAALFDERPDLEAEFNEAMIAAYRAGGPSALENEAFTWGSIRVGQVVEELLPGAPDEDVRAWLRGLTSALATMLAEDPFLCHDYLFGEQTGSPLRSGDLPPEISNRMMALFNDIVPSLLQNRGSAVEFTPTEDDQSALTSVAASFAAELGEERVRFVQGERPATEEDARIVCRAVLGFYESILEHPRDVRLARMVLKPQG